MSEEPVRPLGLLPETLAGLKESMAELQTQMGVMLAELRELKSRPAPVIDQPVSITWTYFSVEEVASMIGRSAYSIREFCRLGRINAVKRAERRGAGSLWSILADEVARYRNEGSLPMDPTEICGTDLVRSLVGVHGPLWTLGNVKRPSTPTHCSDYTPKGLRL